jgi:hypothetical protein
MVHSQKKTTGNNFTLTTRNWGHHLSKDPQKRDLQKKILYYLYQVKNVNGEQTKDHEIMTITINQPKNKEFEFLQDHSRWSAVGTWFDEAKGNKYTNEKNTMIQVEFLDSPSEKVGNELIKLFNEYNKKYIKEQSLYVRTEPVEENSLELWKWRGGE